ncbi:MAG: hypothetical protein LBM96_02545, partial [Methanobrevibacter sp.]|nr:hypothetical protein [Candidatus Methanoflexus mossambicus]
KDLTLKINELNTQKSEWDVQKEDFNNQKNELNTEINNLNNQINDLKDQINNFTNEINDLKEKQAIDKEEFDKNLLLKEENFNNVIDETKKNYMLQLKNKDDELTKQNLKIQELRNIQKTFDEIKSSLEDDFNRFKTDELNNYNEKLKNALKNIVEKEDLIKKLNTEILELKDKVSDLESNIVNQESILTLQKDINEKDLIIKDLKNNKQDENLINALKDEINAKNIRIDELKEIKANFDEIKNSLKQDIEKLKKEEINESNYKLQNALDTIVLKDKTIEELDQKIKLNENKIILISNENDKLNNKIMGLNDKISQINENKISIEKFNTLQNEINEKDAKIRRLQEVKELFSDLDNLSGETVIEKVNDKSQSNDLLKCQDKIKSLNSKIKTYKQNIKELEKVKYYFECLTSPPIKNLTSFQSQIYNILPNTSLNIQELYDHIHDVAFKELSLSNLNSILKNLERKGFIVSKEKDGMVYWNKVKLE